MINRNINNNNNNNNSNNFISINTEPEPNLEIIIRKKTYCFIVHRQLIAIKTRQKTHETDTMTQLSRLLRGGYTNLLFT